MSQSARTTGLWTIRREDDRLGELFYAGRPTIGGVRWDTNRKTATLFRTKSQAVNTARSIGLPARSVIDLRRH